MCQDIGRGAAQMYPEADTTFWNFDKINKKMCIRDRCINSSMLGWDKCVALVKAYLEIKMA